MTRTTKAKTIETGEELKHPVVMGLLSDVKPNDWNPNKMSDHKFESLKRDLRDGDGWLESHPLTIWGSDEKGRTQNIIIDGEHCWKGAIETGHKYGPMVVLHGLTKARAQEITIKLDNNRGDFDKDMLGALLKDIVPTMPEPSIQLGFEPDELRRLLEPASDGEESKGRGSINPQASSKDNVRKTIPIYLDEERHEEFQKFASEIARQCDLKTISDVVFFAVQQVVHSWTATAKAPK